jgi:hypothetical protein
MFFDIIGAHLCEIDPRWITVDVMKVLLSLRDEITDLRLKGQFFRNLLWRINIKEISNPTIIHDLMAVIKTYYQTNPKFYLTLWNVEHCLHYI